MGSEDNVALEFWVPCSRRRLERVTQSEVVGDVSMLGVPALSAPSGMATRADDAIRPDHALHGP